MGGNRLFLIDSDQMIRHVALVWLRPGITPGRVDAITSALSELRIEGMIGLTAGPDLGLRGGGNAGLAIVTDLRDEAAYQAYDQDPGHDRIRRELILPVAERLERCQFQVDPSL